jgi:hypothetical protein
MLEHNAIYKIEIINTWRLSFPLLLGICSLLMMTQACADRMLREMQGIWVNDGGYEVTLPNDPAWLWQVDQVNNRPVFTAQTPELYYPPVTSTITTYKKVKVQDKKQLKLIADSALEIAAKNYQSKDFDVNTVKALAYTSLSGYETTFTGIAHGQAVVIRAFVGHNLQFKLISLQAYAPKQKLAAMQKPVEAIWNSIHFRDKAPMKEK